MGFQRVGSVYKLPVIATQVAFALTEIATVVAMKLNPVIRLQPVGCSVVFKTGAANTVAASDLADGTTKALVSGNDRISDGAIETFKVLSTDAYLSLLSDDHTATGTMWVSIGYEVRSDIN